MTGSRKKKYSRGENMMKKVLCVLLFVTSAQFFYPQTEFIGRSEITFLHWGGSAHGWHNLSLMKNVTTERGPMGNYSLRLADNSPIENEHTELLLHFDELKRDALYFESALYEPELVDIFPSMEIKKFGAGAAGFLYFGNTVRIQPLPGSMFSAGEKLASFSIDFFLYPTSIHEGGIIFSWYAPVVGKNVVYTGIKAFFKNGRLQWLFENVFSDSAGRMFDIILVEPASVRLREWHHHALSYDAVSGFLSIYYDGRESNLRWVTESGKEGSTLLRGRFSPYLAAPLTVGENFYGYIDELRISRGAVSYQRGDYRESGEVRSEVLTLPSRGTRPVMFNWKSIEQSGTAVRVFYRQSDMYFTPDAEEDTTFPVESGVNDEFLEIPGWIQVKNGGPLPTDIGGGRYFQWKADLYGTLGLFSPLLHELHVTLELDPPPSAPILLKAIPLDGGVRLLWVKNKESDIFEYRIYYGSSSGYYFGRGSDMGQSPVSAGNVSGLELRGLRNEEVYFFSITAVDDAGQESGFSEEMVARPSSVYK